MKIFHGTDNAGITRDGLFVRMSDEDWDRVLEVNLTAAVRLTRELAHPMMRRRFGRIVNISSIVGVMGNPGQANYCASKAGMIGFSKSLAQEIASRNVTVNSIAPGFIESQLVPEAEKTPEREAAIIARTPLRRQGQPEEIAGTAIFLASEAARYISGAIIPVDGAYLAG